MKYYNFTQIYKGTAHIYVNPVFSKEYNEQYLNMLHLHSNENNHDTEHNLRDVFDS